MIRLSSGVPPLVLLATLAVLADRANGGQGQPGKVELARPPMPAKDGTGWCYVGMVTEVTKNSVTILWPGEEKAKTFTASDILASGKFPVKHRERSDGLPAHTVSPSHRYRLSDVQVGDHVDIRFAHFGDQDICDEICITKRPGDRVPPLPDGAEPLPDATLERWLRKAGAEYIRYHERVNAYWDLEDKGIPYPEKFGRQRRFPVAPMPRAVRTGPATTP